jgi:ABC-type transport system involved in cytochrome c biogenesis ATPase subunit
MSAALTMTDGDAGLRVIGLRKSYRKRPVIRDVSLDLRRGEVVALLGPNGSGKTTCFYCIAGLVTPEGGQVIVDGRDVTALPMYRRARFGIGYLPQEVSIFRGLSVEDNILAILEIATEDRTTRSERLEELLAEFSIGHLRRARALSLSGGERRRVEIARDRGSHHRSQRARDPGDRGPCLYPARRCGADERHDRRRGTQRERAPRLPWAGIPDRLIARGRRSVRQLTWGKVLAPNEGYDAGTDARSHRLAATVVPWQTGRHGTGN